MKIDILFTKAEARHESYEETKDGSIPCTALVEGVVKGDVTVPYVSSIFPSRGVSDSLLYASYRKNQKHEQSIFRRKDIGRRREDNLVRKFLSK